MNHDLDLDDLPPPNQQDDRAPLFALGTSSPARSPQRPKKRVARWMGDDDDDDLGAIDNLFQDLDDIPEHLPPPLKKTRPSDVSGVADDNRWEGGDDLGIPEEEQGKKKRAPKPKLDENRLLGPNGLPKLKETAKTFKFSKKGNEAEDLKRLMTMYQLWAHQMFPAMNFNDTVNRVENLCKKRTLASALTNWRREAEGRAPLPDANATKSPSPEPEGQQQAARAPSESFDNDLDAALDATQASLPQLEPAPVQPSHEATDDPGFNDADLDLDAEEAMLSMENQSSHAPARPFRQEDNFDADEEAMLELEMEEFNAPAPSKSASTLTALRAGGPTTQSQAAQSISTQDEFAGIDFEDDEEFMREMAQAEMTALQAQEKAKEKAVTSDANRRDELGEDEEELLREMNEQENEMEEELRMVEQDLREAGQGRPVPKLPVANPDAQLPIDEEDLYA